MKKIFCAIFLIVLSFSCKKDSSQNDIPNVLVDFTVYITDPQFSNLNSVNGWVYVSGGVKGIVIYRHTLEEFFAMERNCPYQPANGTQVSVDSSGLFLKDAACGSKFYMTDGGSVANGPATRGLKRYNATFDGTSAVHVYN
jgi:nitrite reductase/ring-hydroxylating ferredoxin subunit